MFKLIAATLAGLFAVLFIFGDETRREEVARAERGSSFDFSFASFVPQSEVIEQVALDPVSRISESEAVAIAVDAGRKLREDRVNALKGTTAASRSQPVATPSVNVSRSVYVSGSKVNLRSGPGTDSAVVAQLTLGTAAEILSEPVSGWVEIRTADGIAGWMSSKFLSENVPG